MANDLIARGASRAARWAALTCIVAFLTAAVSQAFGEFASPQDVHSSPAPTTRPALPGLLSAADFWATTGTAPRESKWQPDQLAELRRLAEHADSPAIRIRATMLLCAAEKHWIISPEIPKEKAVAATAAAFTWIEAHLHDPEIVKYSPQSGFTHVSVSKRADGSKDVWVLIESANHPEGFNGGLNLQFDPKTGTITSCDRWGQIRPVPQ